MVVLMALVSSAWASPERVVHTREVGSAVEDVVASDDGQSIALLRGEGVTLMRISDWSFSDTQPCAEVGGIARDPRTPSGFLVGCGDGSVAALEWSDDRVSIAERAIDFGDDAVLGLAVNDATVFALVENPVPSGKPLVEAYSLESGVVVSAGFPAFVWHQTVHDLAASDQYVVVSHGGQNATKIAVGTGVATQAMGALLDAETSDVEVLNRRRFLVAGAQAGVLEFQAEFNGWTVLLDGSDGLSDVSAIGVDPENTMLAVADAFANEVAVFTIDAASASPRSGRERTVAMPTDGGDVREFGWVDGYLIAGTDNGQVHVLSDRPWVEIIRALPASAVRGDEVTVTFQSDASGEWRVRRNASSNDDGVVVAQGTVEAGTTTTAVVVVDDDFKEGVNRLRIVVEDADGRRGHDEAAVSVDNPPSRVRLTAADIGFGDGRVILDLNAVSDADLSHYMVYVTAQPFEPGDFASGGPEFEGAVGDPSGSQNNLPRRVAADPGENKTVTVRSLSNGTTYYAAVRAYDAAGQEGPMSNVVSEQPRETFGASDLAGDAGGFACSTASARGTAVGVLALCGLLVARSRRAAPIAAALAVTAVGAPAHASDSEWPQSGTSIADFVGGSFEARYSSLEFSDENLTQVFGSKGHNALWLEMGPTFFELVELTGALGYYAETGSRVDAEGNRSAEDDTMLAIPLTVDATFRLDVLPEQLIVPFVGIGYDYWLWQESWTGGNKVQGSKTGTHTTMGAHLLLDLFQPRRASRLEASSGITDTFITIEYRSQVIGEEADGLTFSADAVSIGLKLDY